MSAYGQKWKWSGRAQDDYASVISDQKWLPKKGPVISHIKENLHYGMANQLFGMQALLVRQSM